MPDANPTSGGGRLDVYLSIRADRERRAIVTHLRDATTGTASLDTLAATLAPRSPTERDDARIRLHHTHLPKLAQTPLLSYDPETATVDYHGNPEIEALLSTIQSSELVHDPV